MSRDAVQASNSGSSKALAEALKPTVLAVLRRPDLWPVVAQAGWRMAPSGWWRRSPFLPIPEEQWMKFRLETAYGGDGSFGGQDPLSADDVIVWLEWLRDWPKD